VPTRQIFRGSLTCQSPGGRSPETQGNPAGKPKGVRNRATLAAEALLDGEAEAPDAKGRRYGPTPPERKPAPGKSPKPSGPP